MSEYPSYLIHYGIQGQKWGVRNYQNLDGTWTEEASIELQKKWEKEGRFKEKWYDIKEEKKKDSNGNTISKNDQSRIRSLISSGKTQEEVARILGISVSTINKYK